MKVAGEAVARGSVETVWGALHDAAILARAIPGCEHFEVCGPGLGQFIAATALPAIGGTYAGKLTIAEQQRPSLLRLAASATTDQGTVTADVTLRLSDTAEATAGGSGGSSPLADTVAGGSGGSSPRASTVAGGSGGSSPQANTVLVRYEVNAIVTGSIAAVGTRLLASAAKRLADEFFAAIDESVTATAGRYGGSSPVEPARPVSDADQPLASARPGTPPDNRAALVAGAAIGLAGFVIGVLAGRRGRRGGQVRP